MIKALIMHWTAGADGVNDVEKDSYNEIVTNDGAWMEGDFPFEAQIPPLRPAKYAAHTLNANSNRGGIAIDAMVGAQERPLRWGSNPMTEAGVAALVNRMAVNCIRFGIPVSRTTTLTHAEVERNLGIKQNDKWDIMVLPGMDRADDPVLVGDELRRRIRLEIERMERPVIKKVEMEAKGWMIGIGAALAAIFTFWKRNK